MLLGQITSNINTVNFLVCVFFQFNNDLAIIPNIVSDKDLNLFDDCAAEWVYMYPQKEERTSSSWGHSKMYTAGTIGNSKTDRASTERNKNGAVVKVRILVELRMYMDLTVILGAMLKYWTYSCFFVTWETWGKHFCYFTIFYWLVNTFLVNYYIKC